LSLKQSLALGLVERKRLLEGAATPGGDEPLADLDIFFLSKFDKASKWETELPREAVYNHRESRIYALRRLEPLGPGKPSQDAVERIMSSVFSAPLNHELAHYFSYRRAVAESGFVLEGEATAAGEQAHRSSMAAVRTGDNDPVRLLVRRVFNTRIGSASEVDVARMNRLAQQRITASPYTPVQCRLLQTLYRQRVLARQEIPLADVLLTLTPVMFQRLDPQRLEIAYGEAWAVYEVDRARETGWQKAMERMVRQINEGKPLRTEDRLMLQEISGATLEWVKRTVEGGRLQCEPGPAEINKSGH
jgi:hypothetical protein